MISFDDVICYKRAFTDDDFAEAQKYLYRNKWGLQVSRTNHQSHKQFWMMDLSDEPFFTEKLFTNVTSIIGSNFEIQRVYANGQTYGQSGVPHEDSSDPNAYTFLVYMNREWDILWAGDTIFLNSFFDVQTNKQRFFDGDYINKTMKISPQPNNAIFFPGRIIHFAESPSRDFYGVRTTLAYKLIKKQ